MRMLTSLDLLEQQFFDPSLLSTNYFAKKRAEYLDAQSVGFNNPLRDYPRLLRILTEVRDHRADHANSYTKRLRSQHRDYRSCEAVFSELADIVSEQERFESKLGVFESAEGIFTGSAEVATGFVFHLGDIDAGEVTGAHQAGQWHGVPAVGFDAVTGLFGHE